MAAASILAPWREFVRRNERPLILAWIAGSGLVIAGLWVWGIGLQGAERWIDRSASAWLGDLDEGRTALASGDTERAVQILRQLDRERSPESIKTRWDDDHKEMLSLLAEAETRAGRKGRSLDVLGRLVEFDPLDLRSHVQLARTAEGFGEGATANDAWAEVLRLDPNHVEAMNARVIAAFEAGRWELAVSTFENYLDQHELAEATWTLVSGDGDVAQEIEFDPRVLGSFEEHEIPVELGAPWVGTLELRTGGHSVEIESIMLLPAIQAGRPRKAAIPVDLGSLEVTGGTTDGPGFLIADSYGASLSLPIETTTSPVSTLRVKARFFKTVDAEVLDAVRRCARNLVQEQRYEALLPQVRIGGHLGERPPSER